jgi:6-phosphogluconolactonase (cycloisomerase 2 family)
MRMKLNRSSQLLLVAVASLLVAGVVTACGTLTTDFVFVTSAKAAGSNNAGEIDVFEVNSESGHMRQIPTSPFPSGGRNPVAEAVSSDNTSLYVVNQDDNNIVQFVIGNDGKLYPNNTVNTPGLYPLGIAVSGSNLFVVDTYQPLPGCAPANPCSGSISVFPLASSSSTLPGQPGPTPVANGSLTYWPLALSGANAAHVIVPTAVNVLASGAYVYVTAYDASVTPHAGYVFGFAVGTGGVLTPLSGSPFTAGTQPSAIASDPTSKYLYVTDYTNGGVLGYSIASGALTALAGSPFAAGNAPSAIVVDSAFSYVYVTNATDATITAYSMSNGVLKFIGNYPTGLQPVALGIDPSTHHFLYTANFLGNSVSSYELSETAGTLLVAQGSPSASNVQPTAVAAIPHGGQK